MRPQEYDRSRDLSWEEAMRLEAEICQPTSAERLMIEKIEHEVAEENKRAWAEYLADLGDVEE